MGRVFELFLDDAKQIHTCSRCAVHLADDGDLIGGSVQGDLGRARLFERAVNILRGPPHERVMMTGAHRVADIFCVGCTSRVGWVYIAAPRNNHTQNYKTGKILLEQVRTALVSGDASRAVPASRQAVPKADDAQIGAHRSGYAADE